MTDRVGQVWVVGGERGYVVLITAAATTARATLDPSLSYRGKSLDAMLVHEVLLLECGATGIVVEDREGKWDRSKNMERIA